MRHIFFVLLLAASSTAAAEWMRLAESGDLTLYVEPTSAVRVDAVVGLVSLHDYKTPRTTFRGWIYRSEKVRSEFDCQRERWRVVHTTFHPGPMGTGPVFGDTYSGPWAAITPASVAETAWKFACGKT